MKKGMTVRQAAEKWVGEMDAIQQGMIQKLMQYEPDDWEEVTLPSYADRVYVDNLPDDYEGDEYMGEIIKDHGDGTYTVRLDDDDETEIEVEAGDITVQYNDSLPMWSTMWSMRDWSDTYWVESRDGVEALSRCGFRVYKSSEFGYFFGIDGAGYDFYEKHWILLYRERGLQWHDEKTEQQEAS